MSEILFNIEKGIILKRKKDDKHWAKHKYRLCVCRDIYYWIPDYFIYNNFNFHIANEWDVYFNNYTILKDVLLIHNRKCYKWTFSTNKYYFKPVFIYNMNYIVPFKNILMAKSKIVKPKKEIQYKLYGVEYGWKPI